MGLEQIMGMLQQMQAGQERQLGMMQDRPMLKPRTGIPVNTGYQTEWKIRGNPNYKPYDPMSDEPYGAMNSSGQRVRSWRDDKSPAIGRTGPNGYTAYGPNGPPPVSAPAQGGGGSAQGAVAPKATQGGGRGFADWFKGLFDDGDGQPGQAQQPAAPQTVPQSAVTGPPAPEPFVGPPAPRSGLDNKLADPQVQNILDIANFVNSVQAHNPEWGQDRGFDPGLAPNIPFGQPQTTNAQSAVAQPTSPYTQQQPSVPQAPQDDLTSVYGQGASVRPGMGALNTLTGLNAPGLAATGVVNRTLLPAATYAANQLPQLRNAYQSALGTVGAGQKALQAGAITAGELAPAMSAASNAYNSMVSGVGTASSTAKSLASGQKVAGALAGGSRVAPIMQGASRVAAPAQAALMLLEAGRLAGDQDYREQATADYETLAQQNALQRLWQAMGAPVATIGNTGMDLASMVSSFDNANVREQQNQRIERDMKKPRSPEQVKARALAAKKRRDNQ